MSEERIEQGQTFADEFDPMKLDEKRRNPKFHYRFVLDSKDKVAKAKAMGYEVDQEYSKKGDRMAPTLRGDSVLMRIPIDIKNAISQAKVKRQKDQERRISEKYRKNKQVAGYDTHPTVEEKVSRE